MALYYSQLNDLLDRKYFLELDETTRATRRGKNGIVTDPDYETEVLMPMHKKFVEPTKEKADLVIDVAHRPVEDIVRLIQKDLSQSF